MKNNKKIWIYGAVLIAFLAFNKLAYDFLSGKYLSDNNKIVDKEEDARVKAVDFTVKDLKGNEVKLSSFYGKPIVLTFWASWCSNCAQQMPGFQAVYDEFDDTVVFMMVNVTDGDRETAEDVSAFVEATGYTLPVYLDEALEASRIYNATGIPLTYIIDKDGYIVGYAKGAVSENVLRDTLKRYE